MYEQYFADFRNLLFEMGVLKEDEQIVDIIDNCLLLERVSSKGYHYRAADPNTLKTLFITTRKARLPKDRYGQIKAKIKEWNGPHRADGLLNMTADERATALLIEIFINILPKHQMVYREPQLNLSLKMMEALHKTLIALCEAEVGTGKTHAYILAIAIKNLFLANRKSTIISTSTIALQKALTDEYLPQISKILLEHRISEKPFYYVVRKGKKHYVCDKKLHAYRNSLIHTKENADLITTLDEMLTGGIGIDLDEVLISDYVKRKICVTHCDKKCSMKGICRYNQFISQCLNHYYDFQITNHNLLIADLLVKRRGGKPLLATFGQVVIDEAHKLTSTVHDMYGVKISDRDIELLNRHIIKAAPHDVPKLRESCYRILLHTQRLFNSLEVEQKRQGSKKVNMIQPVVNELKALIFELKQTSMLFLDFEMAYSVNLFKIRTQIEDMAYRLTPLTTQADWIMWLDISRSKERSLCALPKRYGELVNKDLWELDIPIILTSGTMSIKGDFSYLEHNAGLREQKARVIQMTTRSPFEYNKNALLYLPLDMPFPDNKSKEYLESLLLEIEQLIKATHGHTLVLFTSYNTMEQAFIEMQKRITEYPMFIMGRGQINVIETFRNSKNGVLFASDSAGEGIDLAGDILSSVVIAKLPFPIPDAISEYECSLHNEFESYLTDSIIPTMLIKLRQWIGRGIRRETDTCVFSILDSRAVGRYQKEILSALPQMPVTNDIVDVGRFILNKKNEDYFA